MVLLLRTLLLLLALPRSAETARLTKLSLLFHHASPIYASPHRNFDIYRTSHEDRNRRRTPTAIPCVSSCAANPSSYSR